MANKQAELKVLEADKQMKDADKLAQKTLFKWKPDWEGAAVLYDKAANNYKNAKAYEKAKDAFQKASSAHYHLDIYYSAGKQIEAAAGMAKELKQAEEAANLYEKACLIYREGGSGFNAAESLTRGAKILETTNGERCMSLLKEACELFELEDKQVYSGDTFKSAINLFLRNKKYGETIELMKNQNRIFSKLNQQHDHNKSNLSIIIIFLYCDDFVAANNHFISIGDASDFGRSEEGRVAGELLDAFETRNPEALKKCISKQVFTFLDNQVCKIVKAMSISDGLESGASLAPTPLPPPSSSTSTTTTSSPPSSSSSSSEPSTSTPSAPPAPDDEDLL
eukprot:TRINITY_DN2727_c0_g1_i3.p1 TRINITY_DN2727_c0_g1~~TRINITY_DN2727_c0_g1_i3.p1  ORF type:complete len:337 (+),score=114.55 TRINITY_DN2727_c0_g1_i3:60-1070(+)